MKVLEKLAEAIGTTATTLIKTLGFGGIIIVVLLLVMCGAGYPQ